MTGCYLRQIQPLALEEDVFWNTFWMRGPPQMAESLPLGPPGPVLPELPVTVSLLGGPTRVIHFLLRVRHIQRSSAGD